MSVGAAIDVTAPAAVLLHRVRFALRTPHAAAHGVEVERDLILVEVRLADGTVGWGECSTLSSPTYTAEHTAGAWVVLRDRLAPAALAGREFEESDHPMAIAGLRTALDDALDRIAGRSRSDALASAAGLPPARAAVERCAVVSRHDVLDDLVAEVAEHLERRVAAVKLKVTPSAEDLAAVGAVRLAWPDVALAVDFNGTATDDAMRELDRYDLAYVEQPGPAADLARGAALASLVGCPVALDESVSTASDLVAAGRAGAGRIVNVKPARCGGTSAAVELLVAARDQGFDAFVGGMVESGVGRAAALAVAAQELAGVPTDLGPSFAYVDVDLTDPIELDDLGRVVVPDGLGIGRVPHADRLAARTVDHVELR